MESHAIKTVLPDHCQMLFLFSRLQAFPRAHYSHLQGREFADSYSYCTSFLAFFGEAGGEQQCNGYMFPDQKSILVSVSFEHLDEKLNEFIKNKNKKTKKKMITVANDLVHMIQLPKSYRREMQDEGRLACVSGVKL